jgi:purine-binding chemotaxis protein CheW
MTPATETHAADGLLQLVAFRLGPEEYAVDVANVQEIVRLTTITAVPRSAPHVEGVVNLRGRVVPVIDLAKRFGMPASPRAKTTRIVITTRAGRTVGILVDAVSEVLRLSPAAVAPPPEALTIGLGEAYVTGIGQLEGRLLFMLDLARVLDAEDAVESAVRP